MSLDSRLPRCVLLLGAGVFATAALASAQIIEAQMNPVGPTTAFPAGVAIRFGSDLAALGDIDGDGLGDLAVADAGYHATQAVGPFNIGAVHIFSGTGNPAPLLRSVFGTAQVDYFGNAVAAVDDLTGDGIGELAIGAHQVGAGTGYVRIVDPTNGATVTGPVFGSLANGWFGHGLAAINDLDGDALRDLVVLGFQTFEVISTRTGASLTGPLPCINNFSTVFTHPGPVAVEDVNADGFHDILIGGPNLDQVDVIDGGPFSFGTVLSSLFGTPGSRFGFSVAAVGDQDADGANDVAIGAPGADLVEIRTANPALPLVFTRSGTGGTEFGFSTSILGPNGVGSKIELLTGAPNNPPNPGAAEVFSVSTNALTYAIPSVPPVPGCGTRVVDAGIGANGFSRPAIATGQVAAGAQANVRIFFGAPAATATPRGTGCGPSGPGLLVPNGVPTFGNAGFGFFHISPIGGTPGVIGVFAMGAPSAPIAFPAPPCFTFFNPTGSASITFTPASVVFLPFVIPANPALAGVTLTAQAAIFGGPSLELSNGVDFTVGY
jgi:hypothetical protein